MLKNESENLLVLDVTCSDIYASSPMEQLIMAAGTVGSQMDLTKVQVFLFGGNPARHICFTPIMPLKHQEYLILFPDLSKIARSQNLSDRRIYSYLLEHLSVDIQRGNAASIRGTIISSRFIAAKCF